MERIDPLEWISMDRQAYREKRDELNEATGLHFTEAFRCEMVENEKGEMVERKIERIF